jgi:glycosyltransferase involved in cell wall biosynthesis
MRILFFIGSLKIGGTERQVSLLAQGMAERGHIVRVVTLFPGGEFENELRAVTDVEIISLWSRKYQNALTTSFQILWAPILLRKILIGNEIVYSMLNITNSIAWVSTRYLKDVNLVWGLRSSNIGPKWKMSLFNKFCALASPSVELIIVNSYKGLETSLKQGFSSQHIQVISNGIDTDKYKFDQVTRNTLRRKHSIQSKQKVIGIVARIDPMKDHTTFFKAAARIAGEMDQVRFMVVGDGSAGYVGELRSLVEELGLKDRVHWFGTRTDIVAIYCALDLLVSSSSYGEGFSNVIGEAMSCGLSCVVTDVGDSARIVGDPNRVVRPNNPEMLASTILKVLKTSEARNESNTLRERIIENYSVQSLIDRTLQALGDNLDMYE